MQRALSQAGTSFDATLARVRQAQAHALIAQDLPLSEVSYLLGYADPVIFHRAFVR